MLHLETLAPETLGLIKALQAESLLCSFMLVGGTSLALQYGHRLSVDIDLFSRAEYDVDAILDLLIRRYHFQRSYQSKRTLKGSIKGVMVDVIRHDYTELEIFEEQGVRLLSTRDIAAMKLNAITGNGTRIKDFIDVYYLLERFTLSELVQFYRQKYSQDDCLAVLRSLVYFDDVDLADWPHLLKHPKLTFEEVRSRIVDAVKSIL